VPPASANSAPGKPIPAAAARELKAGMLRMAARFGDPRPTSITAVTAIHSEALRAATPGDFVPSREHETTYLVLMTGNFTLPRGNPLGGRIATGRYLAVLVEPSTFRVSDLGLRDEPPPVALGSYGPVSDLLPQP
jgi:hypothetical protein